MKPLCKPRVTGKTLVCGSGVMDEAQRAKFKAALAEQERAGAGCLVVGVGNGIPAVHDDRLYRGYNPTLRCWVEGRAHERQILKARRLQHCG